MNPQTTTPQQPSRLMTALPFIIGSIGAVMIAVGAQSQPLADAGLSLPTGLLGVIGTVGSALVGYKNQITAAKAPTDPPPVSKDGRPVTELEQTLALAVQQAIVNKDYALAAGLVAAITPVKASAEVKS